MKSETENQVTTNLQNLCQSTKQNESLENERNGRKERC